jgi:ATP-dependent Clp protease protease subunit
MAKKSKKTKSKSKVEAPVIQKSGEYLFKNGILMLVQPFEPKTIFPLVQDILEYNIMEKELQPERITLIINSPGGRVDSCLTLVDTMLCSEIPVDTFCTGLAASCATMVLMAGKRRSASITSQVMSHQYSGGVVGKEHELYGSIRSFEHTSSWMEEHYRIFTKLSIKKIRKHLLCPTDVWLNAEEALNYNIIDEIVNPYENLILENKTNV